MPFASDAIFVRQAGGPSLFYEEYTTTNLYVERTFGAECIAISVANDSTTDAISLSWNGSTVFGELKAKEVQEYSTKGHSSVYVRGATGGDNVRIWGT